MSIATSATSATSTMDSPAAADQQVSKRSGRVIKVKVPQEVIDPTPTRKKAKKTKPKAKPKAKAMKPAAKPARATPPPAADLFTTLPPNLLESILLQSCTDGSTEAIGNFAATCSANALVVAESQPLMKAILQHRFTAEFANKVLLKHDEVMEAAKKKPAAKKKKLAAAKKKPVASLKAAGGAKKLPLVPSKQEGKVLSIRECAFFVSKTRSGYANGQTKQSTSSVCDFCLSYLSLNAIGKQVKEETALLCCNKCCKIHVVNTTDAIGKCESRCSTIAVLYSAFSSFIPHHCHV